MSSKVDTYFHWAELERRLAERMIENARGLEVSEETIGDQWRRCEDVARLGIDRCGSSQPLWYLAGYGASREAKARNRANSFSYAQGVYARSIEWFNNALAAPVSDVATIGKGMIYRGMALAYEGTENHEQLQRTLKLWHAASGSDRYFIREFSRLLYKFPILRGVPEFRALLATATL